MLRDDRSGRWRLHRLPPGAQRVREPAAVPDRLRRPDPDHERDRGAGEEIGAIFHSHPSSEAYPSQTDVNLARWWPGVLWLICSLGGRRTGGARLPHRRRPRSRRSSSLSTESDDPAAEPLACPTCARKYPLTERFCADCEMPLVYVGRGEEEPITAAHERARKVKPAVRAAASWSRSAMGAEPGRGRADPGHPARGGDPQRPAPHPRLRRPRLPRRGPARHPRPGGRPTRPPASCSPTPPRPARRAAARAASSRCGCSLGLLIALAIAAVLVFLVAQLA